MTDSLDDTTLRELEGRLRALEQELTHALEGSKAGVEVVSLDQPIGRLSRIDALQQQKMAEASRRQQALRLGQIRVAISSIASDEYGDCRSCDEPIGVKRLRARPESPFCIRCQGGRERR